MIVVTTYRGHRIEVNAVAVDRRYNAKVRILRLFARDKPHVEVGHLLQAHGEACGVGGRGLGETVGRREGGRVMSMMEPYRLEICDERDLIKSFESRTPFMAISVDDTIRPDSDMPQTTLRVTRIQHHVFSTPHGSRHTLTIFTEPAK